MWKRPAMAGRCPLCGSGSPLHRQVERGASRVSQDDVLFGYRVQLFDLAGRVGVAAACRTFGVHRSTYYAWKRQVDRHGLEMLRPRERRRPRMPNQLSAIIEERIVAFALAYPGLGPRRIASQLARPRWGGIVLSANGSGAACAGTASKPAASGCRSPPATRPRTPRPPTSPPVPPRSAATPPLPSPARPRPTPPRPAPPAPAPPPTSSRVPAR